MGCELTPDLKRSPAKDPTLNCYSSGCLGWSSFADRSRNCIKHLDKADLKNNVLIVMFINTVFTKSHKNARNVLQSVLSRA